MPQTHREDLLPWADDYFLGTCELTRARIFGHPGYAWQKKILAFLYEDGLCVKLPPEKILEKVAENPHTYQPFAPLGSVMKNWLLIIHPEAEDYVREESLISLALEAYLNLE